tara:strand:+ start:10421 stop:11065 length:645 start_codon:yes stop_codon:yes gene_type:complete
MDNVKFELIKVFGPSVFKVTIPENIVKTLNKYIDDIISSKEKSLKLNVGEKLAGDVTQEFKLEKKIMEDSGWTQFLANCTGKWIELETQKKITTFQLINSWIVRQFKNEYNPTHWHGGHISGAGFLKVPKDLGKHVQDKQNKEYRGGNLQLIHGSRMFLSSSTINIKPKVGDFYFFPNYLMHTVFPFRSSEEERRSISFNALIDENIYNVYGKA